MYASREKATRALRETPRDSARARARAAMSGDSRMVVGLLGVILTSYRNRNLLVIPVFTYGEGKKRKKPPVGGGFLVFAGGCDFKMVALWHVFLPFPPCYRTGGMQTGPGWGFACWHIIHGHALHVPHIVRRRTRYGPHRTRRGRRGSTGTPAPGQGLHPLRLLIS